MNPRLKSSKKWTHFPEEYQNQIQQVFKDNFQKQLKSYQLKTEGRIYPEEVILTVSFGSPQSLAQNNFNISISYEPNNPEILEKIHMAVDAIASLMMDYFEKEEDHSELPREWQEFDFDKKKLYFHFSTENSDLEKEANRILGEDPENLYSEIKESDDAMEIAEIDADLMQGPHRKDH